MKFSTKVSVAFKDNHRQAFYQIASTQLAPAIEEIAKKGVEILRATTPVDEGDLKDSYRAEKKGKAMLRWRIMAAPHFHFQEYGTVKQAAKPFIHIAKENSAKLIAELLRKYG